MEFLSWIFQEWMPRAACYAYTRDVLAMNVVGAFGVAACYLYAFQRLVPAVDAAWPGCPRPVIRSLALFVAACGFGHFLDGVVVGYGLYRVWAAWTCFVTLPASLYFVFVVVKVSRAMVAEEEPTGNP